MLGRLVHTTTADGVQLHGFLTEPRVIEKAWIFVHGVNSNFYSSNLLMDLARRAANETTAVLLVNTRGHDILSFNPGPTPVRTGGQVERIADSYLDLNAWNQLLTREGFKCISLLGHSLGALKSVMWGRTAPANLTSIVAVSPPRLNTELLLKDAKRGPVFQEHLQDAMKKCEDGKPEYTMKVRFPLPMWISASAYLDKYGSGDKYDYLPILADLKVPTLWTFGQHEVEGGSSNFHQADATLKSQLSIQQHGAQLHKVNVIANADHSYRGVTSELADCIAAWIGESPSIPPSFV